MSEQPGPAEEPGREDDSLAAVFRAVAAVVAVGTAAESATADRAAPAAGTNPRRLLSVAVAGGLRVAEEVVGCSITEITGGRYRTPEFAGAAALALDLVQYATGRGPCLDAARDRRSYLTDNFAELSGAMPDWNAAAARHGVRSVLSLPLPGLAEPAGINFYAADQAVFRSGLVTARAALLSRVVGILLAGRPAGAPAGRPAAAAVQRALLEGARARVARAEEITGDEAFSKLAERSVRERRSILAVAADILSEPDRPAEGEPPR